MKPTPPHRAIKFLRWFCREDFIEEVEGDLIEIFEMQFEDSPKKARRKFYWSVLKYFRPEFIKVFSNQNSNYLTMQRHNLKLTIRSFLKYRSQFLINLIGLSTAIAAVLFIYLWVNDELGMDKFHQKDEQLFQIYSNHSDAAGISTWKGVPGLLKDELETVPEVESSTVYTDTHDFTLSSNDSYFRALGKFADSSFFDVFSYQLLSGGNKNPLKDESAIIISESLAQKLFGSTDVIGKNITWHFWEKQKEVFVSGVMKNTPSTSSDQFDFIMSWEFYHDMIEYKQWGNYYARIVVAINNPANQQQAASTIDKIFKENAQTEKVTLFLKKYSDQYLFGNYENGKEAGGRIEYVRLFSIVAFFILFIACINFINLSTAKASQRTKEISVKKTLGASRPSLINQHLTESVLISVASMFLALGLVWVLLPQFNLVSGKALSFAFTWPFALTAISVVVFVGLIAGSYPALYLSSFDPIALLKGKLAKGKGEVRGRQVLVVIQFALSIILIVAVIVVQGQMNFLQNKNLGYDRDNILYFEREGKILENSETVLNEIKQVKGVEGAALSGFIIGGGNSTGGVDWEGKTEEDQIQFWEIKAGTGMLELMGMEMAAGREFTEEFSADSASVIINETALEAMGMEDPIGKTITHYTGEKKIVGVVKDFNLISLHTKIEPMIILYNPKETHFVIAKLAKGNEAQTIQGIEEVYKKINPGYVFKPQFLDQDYEALYKAEQRVSGLAKYFSALAILISCLGLFGLSAFTLERRTKEIGIRKVLGAGQFNILYLLSGDFTKMILIGILISLPVSYYLADQWLANFAFHIPLSWWIFVVAGLSALFVAWLTVSIQTIKASNTNPVDTLKSE
ncbi:MAG: ABC transporter permease [Fulvivirga sp.]